MPAYRNNLGGDGASEPARRALFKPEELEGPSIAIVRMNAQATLDGLHRRDQRIVGLMLSVPKIGFQMLAEGLNRSMDSLIDTQLKGMGITPSSSTDKIVEEGGVRSSIDMALVKDVIIPNLLPLIGVLVEPYPPKKDALRPIGQMCLDAFRQDYPGLDPRLLQIYPKEKAEAYAGREADNIFVLKPTDGKKPGEG
ncbi:MAG: hypothetical protein V1875_08950 [Candidatus Altiarchaeota archaeon]